MKRFGNKGRNSEVKGRKSEIAVDGHEWLIFVKQKWASLARPRK